MNPSPTWELETAPGACFNWECDQRNDQGGNYDRQQRLPEETTELTNIKNNNIFKENSGDGEERVCYNFTIDQQNEIYKDIHDPL